jgi:ribosomal protein S18 acetylase RimI-like enzyme
MIYAAARLDTPTPQAFAGRRRLESGTAVLEARPGRLDLLAEAANEAGLAAVKQAIGAELPGLTPDWAVTVRQATLGDDAVLLDFDRTAWTSASGFPSAQAMAVERTEHFGGPRKPEHTLVAVHDGEIAGFVAVPPKRGFAEQAHVFGLYNLIVSARARRHGVGTALMLAAERFVLERGGRKISLTVLATNAPALTLYQRHGYVVEGRLLAESLIDGNYVDDILLAKHLT